MEQNILTLKVDRIEKETNDAAAIYLRASGGENFTFVPGQFLTLLLEDEGREVKRCYSIFTSPDELPELGIAVKRIESGKISGKLVDSFKPGDEIKAMAPLGNFTVEPDANTKRTLILFGAGSGITPLMSILTSTLKTEPGSRVMLYYGNRNEDSIIFRKRLDALQQEFGDRLAVLHSLSSPSAQWQGETGRLTKEKALGELKTIDESTLDSAEFYICGPDGMMKDIHEGLEEIGIEPEKVHRENFTLSISQDFLTELEDVDRKVTVILGGERHVITVHPGDSILETALNNGLQLPSSCQSGACCSCRTRLISGQVYLADQTCLADEDIEKNFCLTCVGYPLSDDVVVDYDDPEI